MNGRVKGSINTSSREGKKIGETSVLEQKTN